MRRTPLPLTLISIVGAAAAVALSSLGTAVLAACPPTSSPGTVGLWAADWGGAAASRTSAEWQAAAENDSVVIGQPGVYKKWMSQLRAWNPELTVLAYNLGPTSRRAAPTSPPCSPRTRAGSPTTRTVT